MTKSWRSYGSIDGCRTFRNLYLSLPNARPVLVKRDLVQADVGATKLVAPSTLRSDRFWLLELRVSRTFLDRLRPQLFRPWIPSSARDTDGGPRRFTEI